MIEKMAFMIVRQMEMQKVIKSSCEYYEYALTAMMENIVTVGTLLFLGLLFEKFLHTLCFLMFFLTLRRRTGGFHANKFFQCYIGTVLTYIAVVQVTPVLCRASIFMYGMLFLAIVLICILGTINHPNVDMDEDGLQKSKKAARMIVLMETETIAVLVVYLKSDILYIGYMSIAVILCAFLMCLAKITKQEVRVK